MSFGKKRSSSGSSKKIRTPNLNTPFGNIRGSTSGSVSVIPEYLPGQEEAINTASQSFGTMLAGIPTSTDFNAAFNNPMYDTLAQLQRSALGKEADEARRRLSQQQAARGNLSNSSGIYAQSLLENNIANTLADNLLKARLGAFDAYNQDLANQINRATFFQNALAGQQNMMLRPLEIYQGIAPLGAQIQQYNNPQQVSGGGGGGLFSSIMGSVGGAIPKLLAGG